MIRAGQRLYDERVKKGLSLEDISKATRIRFSYLSAIEKGEYEELPSSTYAQGFVRNYAKHLGLNEEEILGLFRREFNEEKIFRILPEGLDRKEEFSIHGAKIQNTLLVVISLVVILFAYILFQYRYAIISPSLEVDFPKEGAVVSSQTITVLGKTDSNSTVFINNEPSIVGSDGSFKKTITVFSGETKITIKAINSFGKQKTIERHIEVK